MSSEYNISFFIDDKEDIYSNQNTDLTELLNDIANTELSNNIDICDNIFVSKLLNYRINYNMKELILICDYYGITKELKIKSNRLNKESIINLLVIFELNPENSEIVIKRENMWFYMNEIKNDKFMKKYVLW